MNWEKLLEQTLSGIFAIFILLAYPFILIVAYIYICIFIVPTILAEMGIFDFLSELKNLTKKS